MQKSVFYLLTLLTSIFSITSTFAQFPALVSNVEKAIFQIETYDEFGINLGSGTGFFIDSKGKALTALHVIDDAKFVFIKDYKGRKFRIKEVTRINANADIAEFIIESENATFPFIPLNNSIPAKGSDVFTIGFPEGYERAVSKGIISASQIKNGETIIQTSAAISNGSSGSPLLNMQGQAIGVISYSVRDGQNLNFAYSVSSRERMKADASFKLMGDVTGKFYFMNLTCKTEPNLNLTSIEFTDTATVFNFIFSNISIAFGDGAFIYCNTKDLNQTFHINDRASLGRYYLQKSTLAGSIEEAIAMKQGNVKTFKLIFGPIKELTTFDLKEGMPGGNWSFDQIQLPKNQKLTPEFFEAFNIQQLYSVAFDIKGKRYESALDELKSIRDSFPANERMERLSAVAHFENEEYEKAQTDIERALTFLPNYSNLYADLYEVHMKLGHTEEALAAIEKAILLEPDYIEYYLKRAKTYFRMNNWRNAISDFSQFIESGRECSASIYFYRGYSKAQIKDSTACDDINKAKELADSDREWEMLQKAYKDFCK